MTNLMQHSTGVLDLSDDEAKPLTDNSRGKENIPPAELGVDRLTSPETTDALRKDSKMEQERSPLADLNASDFYPEGCNAFSYVVVYDNEDDDNVPSSKETFVSTSSHNFAPFSQLAGTSIASVLEPSKNTPLSDTTKSNSPPEVDANCEVKSS